jgi:aminoglycoside phosphotransferase (APT) family kinase protein
MTAGRMHADEIDLDARLVTRLIAAQFPHWAGLPIEPVPSSGTDNAMYRLGADLAVRLPRIPAAAGNVDLEQRWLPRLGPHLPVAVPEPLGLGTPDEGYPWPWSVYRWLDGENPDVGNLTAPGQLAIDLARFIAALQRIDPAGAPKSGRGVPLRHRDAPTREAIAALRTTAEAIDLDAVTDLWDETLTTPPWTGPALWLHSDLARGNILLTASRLSAVIDFAGVGIGDPACDLMIAWNLLPAATRPSFRAALDVDDATWQRGRGWALSVALIQLPYYRTTNLALAASSRHVISEVLADPR